ncbi:hypothetical protein ACUN9Y_19725 [Halomonas sp. V046]|uniref:hypothetical protein n=1 Tax=Halomonas sp. V046 TaxID=3459611 RepID=UPI0040439968
MKDAKPFVSRASSIKDSLSIVARLPSVLAQAIDAWGDVEVVVQKRKQKRSLDQNRLQRLWCKQAAEQGDMTAEEYRGYCKLHYGIPILRRDSEAYREAYDRVIKPLPYEQKLELQMTPFDWPVTRGMNKSQKTEYLNAMWQHFTGLGFHLTDPGLQGIGPDQYREAA